MQVIFGRKTVTTAIPEPVSQCTFTVKTKDITTFLSWWSVFPIHSFVCGSLHVLLFLDPVWCPFTLAFAPGERWIHIGHVPPSVPSVLLHFLQPFNSFLTCLFFLSCLEHREYVAAYAYCLDVTTLNHTAKTCARCSEWTVGSNVQQSSQQATKTWHCFSIQAV